MFKRTVVSVVLCLLCLVLFSGECFAANTVKIVKVSPETSVSLKAGQTVDFQVEVQYTLNDPSATISLVIQRAEHDAGTIPVVGSTMEVITKGSGTVSLKKQVIIPKTKTIQVFTPLLIQQGSATAVVDSRFYKVEE